MVSIPHRYGKNEINLPSYVISEIAFPFLIGTVRTNGRKKLTHEEIRVSIPHRYGKNNF